MSLALVNDSKGRYPSTGGHSVKQMNSSLGTEVKYCQWCKRKANYCRSHSCQRKTELSRAYSRFECYFILNRQNPQEWIFARILVVLPKVLVDIVLKYGCVFEHDNDRPCIACDREETLKLSSNPTCDTCYYPALSGDFMCGRQRCVSDDYPDVDRKYQIESDDDDFDHLDDPYYLDHMEDRQQSREDREREQAFYDRQDRFQSYRTGRVELEYADD